MKTLFKHSYITFITLIFLITALSSFVTKSDAKKEGGKTTIPFWKQANAPDYTAPYLNPKPENKEPDKQQANEFIANAKQNVSFLENKGQMMDTEGKPVPFVLFKAEAPGMNVYITEKGLTYVFVKIEENEDEEKEERKPGKHQDLMMPGKHEEKQKAEMAWINVTLKGATIKRENIIKEEQSTEHFNYFYGHCPNGIYDVYQYKKLTIKNVYPNIDWVFYNSQKGGMKYDFIVHPGANPNDIKLIYESEKPLDLDEKGNLQLKTKLGTLTENAPYSYIKETTTEVKSSFKTTSLNKHEVEVAFNINQNSYTQTSTLVIDPQLVWGTLFGGNGNDGPMSIDTDNNGNVIIAGYTASTDFPLQNAGTFFQASNFGSNVFILKFSNNGNRLWATYYGGSDTDLAISICTDANGNLFITGTTESSDFPLQNPGGGAYYQGTLNGNTDAFILKFSNIGNRLWATYYGGSQNSALLMFVEIGNSICADSNGNVFVTGGTNSSDFPIQNSGSFFQGTYGGGEIDGFIIKFSNNGSRLWATYYGASDEDSGTSICTDSNGNVFVVGYTESTDFPVQNAGTFFQGTFGGGNNDVFILKFDNNGNRLWATYYGGSGYDTGNSICTDSNGNLFMTGMTYSNDFPILNAGTFFQANNGGGNGDVFISKFSNIGIQLWSTYFGGAGDEYNLITAIEGFDKITVDNCDNVYLTLESGIGNFPHILNYLSCSYFDNIFKGDGIVIARFNNTGNLNWCTYLGNTNCRAAITVDQNNNVFTTGEWVLGSTGSSTTANPISDPGAGAYFDNTFNGDDDGYIIKLSPSQIQKQVSQLNATNCQCNGSATFSITCGDAPYSYVWSNGTSVLNTTLTTSSITNLCAGVHNVTVTAGCTQTLVETYTISAGGIVAQANVLPGNTICAGQSLTLSTIAANTYTWAGPNNFTANTQNAVINNAQVTSSGVYTISIDSGPGCAATATVAANIQAIEQPNVNFNYQASYCISDGIAKANLSSGFNNGGTFLSNAGLIIDANTGDIDLSASTSGTYMVTYNSTAGFCKAAASNAVQVILNNSPILELNPSNIKLSCGASATITVTGADDYTWSNSALLDCATCSVVVASPYKTTDFCVTGTSKNCTSQTCVNVTTEQTLDVPNAFTPNGDNNNDEFCLQGWAGCVQSFAISVFDRWGQEVFKSNKANFCWDGTYQGKALNTAVFVYSIKATIDGKQISKKGNITLLR